MANWIALPSTSVANGDITVSVTGSIDLSSVLSGWALIIAGSYAEIASGTAANGTGTSILTLAKPWMYAAVSNQPGQVQPTGAPFLAGIKAMEDTNSYAIDVHTALAEIATLDKDVTVTGPAGEEHTFPSLPKIAREVGEQRSDLATDYATKTASLTISATMGYRNAVERESGGKRTLIADVHGNLEQMCVFGRMNYEDLELPELNLGTGTMLAFLTNGVPRSEIFISPYQSTLVNGVLVGIGGQYPAGSMSFDSMRNNYRTKGAGWHMVSMHEWELIRLISRKFNPDITGNTYYGRSHARRYESATRQDGKAPGDTSGFGYTRAGSGPSSWSHDGTDCGVFDIVGNKWEWVDQFKLGEGEIICTPDNQPDLDEALWTPQGIYYDNATGVPKLSTVVASRSDGSQYSYSALNSGVTKDVSYAGSELMRRLGVEHAAGSSQGGVWVRNVGERFPVRGGGSSSAGEAGPSALSVNGPRSDVSSYIVSRSAYSA